MRNGFVYTIYSDIDNEKFIGQTARDPEDRFIEYKWSPKSPIADMVERAGKEHMFLTIIETSLDKLDAVYREHKKFFIPPENREGDRIFVVESGMVFKDVYEAAARISYLTSWNSLTIQKQIEKGEFCGYHFISVSDNIPITNSLVLEDWIITLSIKNPETKYLSPELNLSFSTIGAAAKYLLDNNLYITKSKQPMSTLISLIRQQTKGKDVDLNGYTFIKLPSGPLPDRVVRCLELNLSFNSLEEAARYMVENRYWSGIKTKTAKIRILDILNGVFADYEGFTFV